MTTIQHPDLTRLLAVADGLDASVCGFDRDVDDAVEKLLGPLVDVDSVQTVAIDRTDPILTEVPELLLTYPSAILRAIWQDGFTVGARFQQIGGHTAG